jgi:ribonuclease HI
VAGKSATNSNRATRESGDVLRRLAQARRRGCRGTLDFSKGEQLKYVLQIFWKVSNNEAEYEALLHGLRLAISLGIKRLLVYDDSAVVINQVNKSCDPNKENMDAYCL